MTYAAPGNITSSVDLFSWTNGVTDNWFFPGILIAVFVIILVKMLSNEVNTASKSFAAASFIIMILSVFARIMDFVSTGFMTLFIILTAISAIWMHMENTG